jgi:hypothetical protein
MASESSSLIKIGYNGADDIASKMSGMLGTVIAAVQIAAFIIIFVFFRYDDVDQFTTEKYIIFRDIMVMLLLGFGYCK